MRINIVRILFLLIVATAFAAPARAADISMFVKGRPAPAVVDPWQGFYFGFHLGYGWSKKKYLDNFPVFDGEVDADVQADGFLGGAQLGYNFVFNRLLLGIEGDFSWSAMRNGDFACYPFGDQLCTAKPELFADLTGRLGYIDGPWLYYAKGGVAFVHDRFENYATCAGTQPTSRGGVNAACGVQFIGDHSRAGWIVGGGIETFIARNWSVKLEYNYMDFGGASVTFKDGNGDFFTEEIHQKVHIVKAGLNYHFGAPPTTTATGGLGALFGNNGGNGGNGNNNIVAFAGFDTSKDTYSGWVGTLMSPFGDLDTSGFRLFMLGEGGYYRYPTDAGKISGATSGGHLLAGWGFEGDTYSVNLLAGPSAINHTLNEIDLENEVQGTAFGVMGRADMRLNPSPKWLVYSEGDYSTAFRTFDATAKIGYQVFPNSQMFFGPEAGVNGDHHSHQWRVGAHLSEIKFGSLQFDISAGYARDSGNGPGAYGHIEVSRPF